MVRQPPKSTTLATRRRINSSTNILSLTVRADALEDTKLMVLLFCVGKRAARAVLVAMRMVSLMSVSIHRSLSQKFLLRHI